MVYEVKPINGEWHGTNISSALQGHLLSCLLKSKQESTHSSIFARSLNKEATELTKKKMQYVDAMEHKNALQWEENLDTWINVEAIMLSKVEQLQSRCFL